MGVVCVVVRCGLWCVVWWVWYGGTCVVCGVLCGVVVCGVICGV